MKRSLFGNTPIKQQKKIIHDFEIAVAQLQQWKYAQCFVTLSTYLEEAKSLPAEQDLPSVVISNIYLARLKGIYQCKFGEALESLQHLLQVSKSRFGENDLSVCEILIAFAEIKVLEEGYHKAAEEYFSQVRTFIRKEKKKMTKKKKSKLISLLRL